MPALCLSAFLIIGCSGAPDLEVALEGKPDQSQPQVQLNGPIAPEDVALYHDGRRVKVGDSWSSALQLFPEPKGGYVIRDLPNAFSDKYESHGWDTSHGEGYGLVSTGGKVVGAMYQLERTRPDTLNQLVNEEVSAMYPFHATRIGWGPVKYWFWDSTHQIAMVCAFTTKSGINFTSAIGDKNVMKAFGVSEMDARKQIADLQATEKTTPGVRGIGP